MFISRNWFREEIKNLIKTYFKIIINTALHAYQSVGMGPNRAEKKMYSLKLKVLSKKFNKKLLMKYYYPVNF